MKGQPLEVITIASVDMMDQVDSTLLLTSELLYLMIVRITPV